MSLHQGTQKRGGILNLANWGRLSACHAHWCSHETIATADDTIGQMLFCHGCVLPLDVWVAQGEGVGGSGGGGRGAPQSQTLFKRLILDVHF